MTRAKFEWQVAHLIDTYNCVSQFGELEATLFRVNKRGAESLQPLSVERLASSVEASEGEERSA